MAAGALGCSIAPGEPQATTDATDATDATSTASSGSSDDATNDTTGDSSTDSTGDSTGDSGPDSTDGSSGDSSGATTDDPGCTGHTCPAGSLCLDGTCTEPTTPPPCAVEVSLEAQAIDAPAAVFALAFLDVDADLERELVLVHALGVTTIDGDTTTESMFPRPAGFDGLAGVTIVGGAVDLALTTTSEPTLRTMLGDGAGGFGSLLDRAVAHPLGSPLAIESDGDPSGELAAIFVPDTPEVLVLGHDSPALELENLLAVPNGHEDLVAVDFDLDGDLDMLSADGTTAHRIRTEAEGGWSSAGQLWGVTPSFADARWTTADLDGDGTPSAVAVGWVEGASLVETWAGAHVEDNLRTMALPETYVRLTGARLIDPTVSGDSIVLLGPTGNLRLAAAEDTLDCAQPLDGPTDAIAIEAGDVDGDGFDELATIDVDGVATLWRQ